MSLRFVRPSRISKQGIVLVAGFFLAASASMVVASYGSASSPKQEPGYWLVSPAGAVTGFGDAGKFGALNGKTSDPVVGMASTPDAGGYWLATSKGSVSAFGDATLFGSMAATHLSKPIVGITSTADGRGYWLFAADGGIFAFGDASYFGSSGSSHLTSPVVGMSPAPDGAGYWIVTEGGTVLSFGKVPFRRPGTAVPLGSTVAGMASTPDGKGYWLVTNAGRVMAFGDAHSYGSMNTSQLNTAAVGIAATPDGHGYWLAARNGTVLAFGDAQSIGGGSTQLLERNRQGAKNSSYYTVGIATSFNYYSHRRHHFTPPTSTTAPVSTTRSPTSTTASPAGGTASAPSSTTTTTQPTTTSTRHATTTTTTQPTTTSTRHATTTTTTQPTTTSTTHATTTTTTQPTTTSTTHATTTTSTTQPTTTSTTQPTTTTTTQPTTTTTTQPTTTTTTQPTTTTTTQPTTITTATAGGGNCTNPVYSSSDAGGTYNVDSNDAEYWWVNNDAWSGSHGPQTIYVCNQSSWYASSDQPNNGGQVETYPDTEYDVGGRNTPSTEPISAYNSITSTFSEAYPSAGSWDAGYDLWTNNWTNETMIWNQYAGSQSYWYGQGTPVTIDGVQYHFVDNGNCAPVRCSGAGPDNGDELMFIMVNQEQSGSANILAIYQWEVANGYAKASDVPTQLEYGVEICATSGTETFPMTGLTFSLS